jgi:hypothetical protein
MDRAASSSRPSEDSPAGRAGRGSRSRHRVFDRPVRFIFERDEVAGDPPLVRPCRLHFLRRSEQTSTTSSFRSVAQSRICGVKNRDDDDLAAGGLEPVHDVRLVRPSAHAPFASGSAGAAKPDAAVANCRGVEDAGRGSGGSHARVPRSILLSRSRSCRSWPATRPPSTSVPPSGMRGYLRRLGPL